MLLRSILVSLVAAGLFVSAAVAVSPKKVALDVALEPDCSDVVLHWTWRPVAGRLD